MVKKSLVPLLVSASFLSGVSAIVVPKTVAQEALPQIVAQSSSLEITVSEFQGFTGVISALGIAPDNTTLIAATGDGTITAVDLVESKALYTIDLSINPYTHLPISRDGSFFAAAEDERIVIFNTLDGTELKRLSGHTGKVTQIAIAPDNKTLASVSSSDRTVRIWDVEQGTLVETLGADVGLVTAVAFSPDGKLLVTAESGTDRTIKFWDVASLQLTQTSPKQPGNIYDIAISADGSKLAAAVRNLAKVWDMSTGNELMTLRRPRLDLNALAISPDNQMLATANKEGTVSLWDLNTGKLLSTLTGHQGWVLSLAFSPDSKVLYSGAEDKVVKIWEISR